MLKTGDVVRMYDKKCKVLVVNGEDVLILIDGVEQPMWKHISYLRIFNKNL